MEEVKITFRPINVFLHTKYDGDLNAVAHLLVNIRMIIRVDKLPHNRHPNFQR